MNNLHEQLQNIKNQENKYFVTKLNHINYYIDQVHIFYRFNTQESHAICRLLGRVGDMDMWIYGYVQFELKRKYIDE